MTFAHQTITGICVQGTMYTAVRIDALGRWLFENVNPAHQAEFLLHGCVPVTNIGITPSLPVSFWA